MSLKENELNFNCPVRGLIFWAQSQTMRRNLEVKSLHKKQENLTTENTEITEIFSKVFSVDSVRSVVKSFLVSACPS